MNPVIAIFVGLIALAVAMIAIVFLKNRQRGLNEKARKKIHEVWLLIEHLDSPNAQILEADKLLDHALGVLGFTGSLGDKLKKAGPRFSNINDVWNAHKLRNQLAHELGKSISKSEGDRALSTFKKALKDLGM